MFIGHLPAGFITAKLLWPQFETTVLSRKAFFIWGMLGAIAPDIDMFYFYLIDQRQHHHHSYFTHFPVVWLLLLLLSILWYRLARLNQKATFAVIFSLAGFIHLFLDSIVGDIWWLMPFINKPFALVTVPAIYKPWWVNFLWHWSFGLEIMLMCWAVYVWRKQIKPD